MWATTASERSAKALQARLKLCRLYGIWNVLVTHRLSDLRAQADDGSSASKVAEGLVGDIQTKVVFRQATDQLADASRLLRLNDKTDRAAPRADQGPRPVARRRPQSRRPPRPGLARSPSDRHRRGDGRMSRRVIRARRSAVVWSVDRAGASAVGPVVQPTDGFGVPRERPSTLARRGGSDLDGGRLSSTPTA